MRQEATHEYTTSTFTPCAPLLTSGITRVRGGEADRAGYFAGNAFARYFTICVSSEPDAVAPFATI